MLLTAGTEHFVSKPSAENDAEITVLRVLTATLAVRRSHLRPYAIAKPRIFQVGIREINRDLRAEVRVSVGEACSVKPTGISCLFTLKGSPTGAITAVTVAFLVGISTTKGSFTER